MGSWHAAHLQVSEVVTSLADPTCNIIFGAVVDDLYEGEIHVTVGLGLEFP